MKLIDSPLFTFDQKRSATLFYALRLKGKKDMRNNEEDIMEQSQRSNFLDGVPQTIAPEVESVVHHIREGRFQRSLALVAGLSSLMSGLEVAYEHYRGSYGQRIMYSPVVLSPALCAAGMWAFKSRRAARTVLPIVSSAVLADCLIGFGFHIRGIARKPGGWRIPVTNVVMGPPVFAPLLFGISGYLGVVACFLRREDAPDGGWLPGAARPLPKWTKLLPGGWRQEEITVDQDLREGRFQKHMALATAGSAFFSGVEALYSHYKNNFKYKAQWTPVMIAPVLMGTAFGAMKSRKIAHTALPAVSALAVADGAIGFYYHARGVKQRPGGAKHLLYNIMYGPPVLAPLLFAACGFLGLLASFLRRER
ncbi:MAG TPA: hypothetical protein VFZ27_18770 [Terriglobia bacterium]|nr:hypothetical protein [Terriglobia bacterium]